MDLNPISNDTWWSFPQGVTGRIKHNNLHKAQGTQEALNKWYPYYSRFGKLSSTSLVQQGLISLAIAI